MGLIYFDKEEEPPIVDLEPPKVTKVKDDIEAPVHFHRSEPAGEAGWVALVTPEYYNVKKGLFGPCIAHYERTDGEVRYLLCKTAKLFDDPASYGVYVSYSPEGLYEIPYVSSFVERLDCFITRIYDDPNNSKDMRVQYVIRTGEDQYKSVDCLLSQFREEARRDQHCERYVYKCFNAYSVRFPSVFAQ